MASPAPRHQLAGTQMRSRAKIVDQWVRLGMAIIVIALISLGLYRFSGRAGAAEPNISGIAYRP